MTYWPGTRTIRVAANLITFEIAEAEAHNRSPERIALCLHGFPETAYSWRHQISLLTSLNYRVWAPNLRGYGDTDSPQAISAYETETLVADISCLIRAARETGAEHILLIAHDWGALLAWILVMQDPGLIDRLVILNLPHPACFLRELRRPAQLLKSWYILFFQIPYLPEFCLRLNGALPMEHILLNSTRHPERISNEAVESCRANALRPGGLTAMLNWYRALFRGRLLYRMQEKGFPVIHTPTLMLWGDKDVALSFATTRGTEEYVSNLTLRIFPGISHWIQQEAPVAVNTMLLAWLSNLYVPEYSELPAVD